MKFKKNQIYWVFTLIAVFFISCKKEDCPNLKNHEYEIILQNGFGVYVEHFDDTVTDKNRFNENNEIYKVCNKLTYSFIHEDSLGNRYLFELDEGALDLPTPQERNNAWKYVLESEASNKTVKTINQFIRSGLDPFIDDLPDYNQTVFSFKYASNKDDHEVGEKTGVIENEKNVWMHPPRQMMFRILELNPFPFIQEPYEIGTSWEWNYLRPLGENWSDERWLVWQGPLDISCEYEITDFLSINTPLGELDCYEITAIGHNDYGTTELVSYFNTQYGFVKLNYTNINNSKTTIELETFN